MPKHIPSYINENQAIVGQNDQITPSIYFNRVTLKSLERYSYQIESYESVMVVVSGTCDIKVDQSIYDHIGNRDSVWESKAHSVYAPPNSNVEIRCQSESCEILIAGGQSNKPTASFEIKPEDVHQIQYGSDETKTHRRINHILGPERIDQCDKLLVSELFTVGAGGWSGFPPHKHDMDRLTIETNHEEVYYFKFNPSNGFGAQFCYAKEDDFGPIYHLKEGSTIQIDKGYHPSVAAPGYKMYYFTILVGKSQRDLIQHFHKDHAYQLETIPGIKDMVKGFVNDKN